MDKSTIQKKYIEYVLEEGKKPVSVFAFAKKLKMSESDFYSFYASFEAIENDFWLSQHTSVIEALEKDDTYLNYSAREKLLAYYYTLLSKLRENRSYVLSFQDSKLNMIPMLCNGLKSYKEAFIKYAQDLIAEGIDKQEIKYRKYLSDKYAEGFWIQTMFVINYWIKDHSHNFEMTDAAIEKAVNLSFELIKTNALDNMIDFGKFLLQKAS
jgi:hypothetical protein